MAFRLKLRATELDLPPGELLIGRGTDCFLRLDDDLVSRRHARLIVSATQVTFEDLGSRNGSKVNGEPVTGAMRLSVGDEVEIGAQTFRLLEARAGVRSPTATIPPVRACPTCHSVYDAQLAACPRCGGGEITSEEQTSDPSRSVTSFELLLGVGDKMLALGRVDEAEKMLGPRLRDLLVRAQRGEAGAPAEVEAALGRAMRLAVATRRADWYGYIFELARAARHPLRDELLDELHAHMLAHKPAVAGAVQAYLDLLSAIDSAPSQRRKRVEALLRFCR